MREYDDAALELRLRGVLREHLDGLPFDLTADALDRRREVRDAARRRRRALVALGMAAALLVPVGVLVGGVRPLLDAIVVPLRSAPPVPSNALLAAPSRSEVTPSPSPTMMPTPSPRAWMTGQQLADVLSAEDGYRWTSITVDLGQGQTNRMLQVERKEQAGSVTIRISSPLDSRATVEVVSELTAAAAAGLSGDRIAEVLAPDSSGWIQDAIAHGVSAGAFKDATDTVNGGAVGIEVFDEPIIRDWIRVWFSPEPLPKPRSKPIASDSVVYADSGLIRVLDRDGTDDGVLLINDSRVPGATSVARVLGWSPDGSRLLFFDGDWDLMSTDALGSRPTLIGRAPRPLTRCLKVDGDLRARCEAALAGPRDRELCPALTAGGTCEAGLDDALISADGTRLAYTISDGGHDMMAFFDIASGEVTRVAFDSAGGPACEGPFGGGPLQWSPDGTRFVFGDTVGPRVDGWCQGAIYTIDADGTDPRRVTPKFVHAMDPRWSPDGLTIAFDSPTPRSAWDRKTDATRIPIDMDIYSVRPDGSGLTALTSDHISFAPFWTGDGRILYSRGTRPDRNAELWLMDADGRNATRIDPTIPALTAAGCAVCPFPDDLRRSDQRDNDGSESGPGPLFWRPKQP